jgi:hypothetical protein
MCNTIVQNGVVIRPGQPVMVVMRGPGGDWLMPLPAVWGGSARGERRKYWTKAQGGMEVIIPAVTRWGEVDGGKAQWENLPPGAGLRGILLPEQQRKDGGTYRILKLVTTDATGSQRGRFQNDRAVEIAIDLPEFVLPELDPAETSPSRPRATQGELF